MGEEKKEEENSEFWAKMHIFLVKKKNNQPTNLNSKILYIKRINIYNTFLHF